jgi:D-alanyl-lipoteichoic acid acyltransferase DltB (MBOAT superfamily)
VGYVHSRAAYFACALVLFWVFPVVAIRPISAVILVVGWDCILAAYSYHVDTQKQRDRSLRDFLFFLLVNPALVYRNRGRRDASPSLDIGGLLRVALGLFAMFFSVGLLAALHSQALTLRNTQGGIAGVGAILVVGALRLAREYAVHSGVASLQIGVMRQLGWTIPERYVYPLLARSPAEFWRRWNTYVGDWARIYVFRPLARALGRRAPKNWRSIGLPSAAAVVLTFGVVGVLHDLYIVTVQRELVAPATAWFLAMGLVVVLWHALAARVRRRQAATRWGQEVERVLFLCCACVAAAYLW